MEKTPWNPSVRAIQRVKDPLPIPTHCRYCCDHVEIAHHMDVFGRINNSKWPWLYICKSCGAYVGMHPFTDIPLGTLADKATRNARMSGHRHFEEMREKWNLERTDAYYWLARKLGINKCECHFGWFDIDTCHRAKEICENMIIKRGNYHD
ncbi:zinc-finger-containing protein [Photorhabdus sp. RM71S]|uniref:zinc-finger-containing protein n=1 Tax=Photorhabdus sp. RM71S TaxID=3342824 RepID=UPI0036DC98EE